MDTAVGAARRHVVLCVRGALDVANEVERLGVRRTPGPFAIARRLCSEIDSYVDLCTYVNVKRNTSTYTRVDTRI